MSLILSRFTVSAAALHAFPQIFNRDLLFVSVSHRRLSENLPAANADGLGLFTYQPQVAQAGQR
jgi:hypothetical protein